MISMPAWSMGTPPKSTCSFTARIQQVPGYSRAGNLRIHASLQEDRAEVAVSAGRILSSDEKKTAKGKASVETPGPGTYEVNVKSAGPRVSIAGKREEKCKDASPGPIYYPPLKPSSSATFRCSIRGKPKEIVKKEIPGPGTYDLDTLHPSRSAISFGREKRKSFTQSMKSFAPAPGSYDFPAAPILERKGPKYS